MFLRERNKVVKWCNHILENKKNYLLFHFFLIGEFGLWSPQRNVKPSKSEVVEYGNCWDSEFTRIDFMKNKTETFSCSYVAIAQFMLLAMFQLL